MLWSPGNSCHYPHWYICTNRRAEQAVCMRVGRLGWGKVWCIVSAEGKGKQLSGCDSWLPLLPGKYVSTPRRGTSCCCGEEGEEVPLFIPARLDAGVSEMPLSQTGVLTRRCLLCFLSLSPNNNNKIPSLLCSSEVLCWLDFFFYFCYCKITGWSKSVVHWI